MSGDKQGPYKTGYKKPPQSSQFKPGQSGNPAGRPPDKGLDVGALLLQQAAVYEGGKNTKVDPREASLLSLAKQALAGNTRALIDIVKKFDQAGLIGSPKFAPTHGVLDLPVGLPGGLCFILMEKEGRPPWSDKVIAKHKPAYLAGRSEKEKAYDEFIRFE